MKPRDQWRTQAQIFDVLIDGVRRGQVAALTLKAALLEARKMWPVSARVMMQCIPVGPLYPASQEAA